MLKFWIHIRYGDPGYVNGWVGIKESPQEQDPEMIEKIKEELRNAAGKVTSTFLAEEDMEGFQGTCYPNLSWISRLYESCANKPADSRATWYNEWYNAQDKEIRPTIVLSVDEYWRAFARYPSPTKLRQNFNLAWIILHDFAHASIMLWQPEISGLEEPIIQSGDIFPEVGAFCLWGRHLVNALKWSDDVQGVRPSIPFVRAWNVPVEDTSTLELYNAVVPQRHMGEHHRTTRSTSSTEHSSPD
jgi:hypothetical protein